MSEASAAYTAASVPIVEAASEPFACSSTISELKQRGASLFNNITLEYMP